MKKLLLILILSGVFQSQSRAQYYMQFFDGSDTSMYNSFQVFLDNSSANIWQIGQPQKLIFDSAATSPNVIVTDTISNYPTNNTSSFTIKIPNWTTWGVFALQWMQQLDMDSVQDGGVIEYSTDTGNTWVNVFNNPYVYNFYGFDINNADTLPSGEFAFSGTDHSWRNIWLCFDFSWLSTFNNDTILFRFTLKSDSIDNGKEGWMIDNMIAQTTIIHTIKEKDLPEYLNIYPNPSNTIINIQLEKIQDYHIIEDMQLINAQGKIVQEWKNIPVKFWIDSKKYSPGLYFLKVRTNIKTETRRLIIE